MLDKLKKRSVPFFIGIMMSLNAVLVHAAGETDNTNQIVFVLDGSKSMAGDKWQEAVDAVGVISAMLPSDHEAAVVVYNDDVLINSDFCLPSQSQMDELRSIVPRGYTNTGMALEAAFTHFSQENTGQRRVVVITDGEISMKEPVQTEEAVALYEAAVEQAKEQNVIIDVLMIGTEDFAEQISAASEKTGGFIFKETETQSIARFIEAYLFEQLGLDSIAVGMSDAENAVFHISMQDACSRQVKILTLSESPIEDINVNCQSGNIQVFQAETAAVIELSRPAEDEIDFRFTTSEKGETRVYLVKEYEFFVDMSVSYSSEALAHVIEVSIVDAKGNAVFEDEDLKNKIDIYVNDDKEEYTIERGRAVIVRQTEEDQEIQVRVAFERIDGIVFGNGEEKALYLELPPAEEPEEENDPYIWLYAVTAGVCFVFLLSLFILLRVKKKTEESAKQQSKQGGIGETPKYDFSGQLMVYMLKKPTGEDMPPASINLYQRESREPFSFAWVSDKCHMDIPLKDADRVQFQGGAEHTLCVKNKGDVTVVYGKEVLMRNQKCILHYNEKLLLIFNDGEIEMEVHYKNMKPSERER